MAEFTIIYFNTRGLAEPVRVTLELSGKQYKEELFEEEQWPDLKKKMTESGELAYGSVPLLKHNGKNIVQSGTILRYLDSDDEKWQIDMIIDGVNDLKIKCYSAVESENKEAAFMEFLGNVLPVWIGYFENLKKKNGGDWFVGKRVSIADVVVFCIFAEINSLADNAASKSSEIIKTFMDSFEKQPKYAEYRKSSRYHN